MKLSLVLPAFNEAAVIAETISAVARQLSALAISYEIIVGDDGSTDDTSAIAASVGCTSLRVVRRPHRGKGGILTACFTEAFGEYLGFLDADLEISADYLPALVAALDDGFDVAIASKVSGTSLGRERVLRRRVATRAFNGLVRVLFHSPLRDHQAGLKMFRADRLRAVLPQLRSTGWFWDTEVLVALLDQGCRVQEIPVQTRAVRDSKVAFARTSAAMLRELVQLYLARSR